ncbi:MAG: putative lipid II flippase FtsW [Verrucomicrobia bacterium]|jgi:cell division protein FtsW|nr:putative lipid II flippase FtsW [Verrucomicrobiota bacterium]
MRRAATLMIAFVLMLIALGIVMLYSTSSARTIDPHFYLKRQLLWLFLSIIAGTAVAKFDYHYWQRLAIPLFVVTLILLVLVFVPGIGAKVKGSFRWLKLGPFRFQPSELAKLACIVGMATWMARFGRRAKEFRMGLFYPFCALSCMIGLVFLEPDFGTTFVTTMVGMAIMFVGGTKFTYLLATGVAGLSLFTVAIMQSTERLERILAFLWPDKYPDQAYHLAQSKIAFIMGGPFGVGLGNSMQKRFYLPEAHTDFILSIVAEELGFVATLLVILLFVGIFFCGMTISSRATEPFGRLLGFGVTMMLSLQAAINVGVVTGCLPTKGLPLPFLSYGGSSLMMSIVMCSILLSIAQHTEEDDGKTTRSIKDRAHRL